MKKRLISSGVTIADVAEAAGVSVSLVSFVLNAKRGPDGEYMCSASRATAEKIVETATRLGYHKNMAASALRTGYSKTLGIVVADISNSFSGIYAEISRTFLRRRATFRSLAVPTTIRRKCVR